MKRIYALEMSDGVFIHVVSYAPSGECKGHIHFLHGLGDHHSRYEPFFDYLNTEGYFVSTHDQRGHGETGKKSNHFGYFAEHNGFERITEDVREIIQHVRQSTTLPPVILIGHSMGSFVARRYAQLYGGSIQSLIAIGTIAPTTIKEKLAKPLIQAFVRFQGKEKPNELLQSLSFGAYNKTVKNPSTEFDWLSHNKANVQTYIDDPYTGFVSSNQLFLDLSEAFEKLENLEENQKIPKNLPILLLSGKDDALIHMGKGIWKVAALYEKAGLTNVTVSLIEKNRHEVLMEENKEETYKFLVKWIEGV
ncbi:alpha/beta fold hydrolase [Paenisporosarcina cavernae]|uniref:Alpha/beta hydrolase n=1 Tax=Paenisporosarcina cavernae TaxID=2320858 RepID=A0A385YUF9_9BACL|nr:alpha/beta hydrolase [Paenisporosarcina cavernae]AYC29318.1 alpha/beta hydrolase [Paenisporosarcina cavernae]